MQKETGLYKGIFKLKYKSMVLKTWLVVLGFLVVLVGFYPFVYDWGFLPGFLLFLPMEGVGYRVIIVVLGLLAMIIGIKTKH